MNTGYLAMQRHYQNGGPGVLVSGLVWSVAALVIVAAGLWPAMVVFFFGGMVIMPVGTFISRMLRTGQSLPDKKLTQLAVASLPILFGGLFLGYVLYHSSPAHFFPTVAIAIGLRYLVFRWVYGLKTYWVLGGVLIAIGAIGFATSFPLVATPWVVGLIEIGFGFWLTLQAKKTQT